jgi:plasmid stabilization system protein ParE
MAQVQLSRRAYGDLRRLRHWLEERNPEAADRAASAILTALRRLELFPLLAPELPGTRFRELSIRFGKRSYIARYAVDADRILVTRIWHGRERRD